MNRAISALASAAVLLLTAQTAAAQEPPRERPPIETPVTEVTTGTPVLLSRQSATTTVMSGEDLRSLGVRFLSDGFRVAPGLEITRISSTEANVSLRGYNDDTSASQGVMALLDRRQVYNEFLGNVVWEALPVSLYEIDRVEILRGPGSFLYGPNAMHGLVNFITRSPMEYFRDGDQEIQNPQEVWLCFQGGSYRSNTETLIYVHREGDLALKVKLGHDDINEFEPATHDAKNKVFAEAKLEAWLDGRTHRIETTFGIARQSFNVLIPTFSSLLPATFDNFAYEPYAKINHSIGQLQTQISWTRFDATGSPNQVYSPFHVIADTADIDLQWSVRPHLDHRLTVGTGFRYATFATEELDVSDGRHQTALGWLFAQDEWTLSENVFVTGGVRVDHHSRSGTSYSPRLAFVWLFAPETERDPKTGERESYGQSVRLTAGTGHRNPSLRELWFDMPVSGGAARIVGNPDLKPEQMRSFELGYWGRPHRDLQIEFSLYYNLVDRLVQYANIPLTTDFGPDNVNQDRAFGGELAIEARVSSSIFAFGNYACSIRQDRETYDRNPSAPVHKGNAGIRVGESGTGWNAMTWITFASHVVFQDPVGITKKPVDGYSLVNARIAYQFKAGHSDGRVYVQAFNLLDHDHREHAEGQAYGILAMAGLELAW